MSCESHGIEDNEALKEFPLYETMELVLKTSVNKMYRRNSLKGLDIQLLDEELLYRDIPYTHE